VNCEFVCDVFEFFWQAFSFGTWIAREGRNVSFACWLRWKKEVDLERKEFLLRVARDMGKACLKVEKWIEGERFILFCLN
jgi:hypothetical protein